MIVYLLNINLYYGFFDFPVSFHLERLFQRNLIFIKNSSILASGLQCQTTIKLQISFLILTWILAVENLRFSDDFKRNRSLLVRSKSLNNRAKFAGNIQHHTRIWLTQKRKKPIIHLMFYKISLNKIPKQGIIRGTKSSSVFQYPAP